MIIFESFSSATFEASIVLCAAGAVPKIGLSLKLNHLDQVMMLTVVQYFLAHLYSSTYQVFHRFRSGRVQLNLSLIRFCQILGNSLKKTKSFLYFWPIFAIATAAKKSNSSQKRSKLTKYNLVWRITIFKKFLIRKQHFRQQIWTQSCKTWMIFSVIVQW